MSDPSRDSFALFLRTVFGDLIRIVSTATGAPLAILDMGGRVLIRTVGTVRRGRGGPRAVRGRRTAPIETDQVALGRLVTFSGDARLGPLATVLAREIERHFGLECHLDEVSERLAQAFDEIHLLYRFAHIVSIDQAFSVNARCLLEETVEVLDGRLIAITMPDQNCLIWAAGPGAAPPAGLRSLVTDRAVMTGLLVDLVKKANGAGSSEPTRHPGAMASPSGPVTYSLVPVSVRSRIAGYAALFRMDADLPFATGELRLLECLAHELSKAATTQVLHGELQGILFNVVKSLVTAIEAKDEYTRGHSVRVYDLCVRLGQHLELSVEELRVLSWAALLHDIGKLAIDGAILRCPSELNEEQFRQIRTHPEWGCRVLEPIAQFREMLPGIHHHHERYDGNGYRTV